MSLVEDIRNVIGQIDRVLAGVEFDPPKIEWQQDRDNFSGALHGARGSLKGALILLGEDPYVVLSHCSDCGQATSEVPCPYCGLADTTSAGDGA